MKKLHGFILIAFVLACLGLPTDNSFAQERIEGRAVPTCGSDWARHHAYCIVPETTKESNRTSPEGSAAWMRDVHAARSVGSEKFFVAGQMEKVWGSIMASPVYKGKNVLIWLADEYYDSLSLEAIGRLAVGLEERVKAGPATRDPNKGVIANDIEMFGEPSIDRWSGGKFKVHVLLMKISSPIDGGGVDGYFSPHDQTDCFGSNKRNLLYIDLRWLLPGRQEGVDHVLGTIAHEFQHLINYSRYAGANDETHWMYNEGLSEVASIRNGYWSRNADNYLNFPNKFGYFNAPIGSGCADSVLRAYERAMLWTYYLSERFGDKFLYELVPATGIGIEPVRTAMQRSGHGGDAESVMGAFWAANYLQRIIGFHGDPQYTYEFPVSSIPSATVPQDGLPLTPRTESVNILEYAAYYPQYENLDPRGAALKIRFFSGANRCRIHAIISRPDHSVDVQPVSPDADQVFTGFMNIIFAIANVSGSAQTVCWSAEKIVPGEKSRNVIGSPGLSMAEPNRIGG